MTRSAVAIGGFLALTGIALAQAPAAPQNTPPITFRGDRFEPLTADQLTPEQRTYVDHVLRDQKTLTGPFNALARAPEMGDLTQQLGAYVRFRTSTPAKLNELAILLVARFWTADFIWLAHKRAALNNGLAPAVVDAIANGQRPAALQPDEEVVYNFANELVNQRRVTDATFQAITGKMGEKAVVELMGVMGYFNMLSMITTVDRYPLPNGVKPDLKPLP